MRDKPLDVPALCKIQREFAAEYRTSKLAGISESSVHITGSHDDAADMVAMQEVAPLEEWQLDHVYRDGQTYQYATFVDGVKFICLLSALLPQDQPAEAQAEA